MRRIGEDDVSGFAAELEREPFIAAAQAAGDGLAHFG
jgi:hypothetical protein